MTDATTTPTTTPEPPTVKTKRTAPLWVAIALGVTALLGLATAAAPGAETVAAVPEPAVTVAAEPVDDGLADRVAFLEAQVVDCQTTVSIIATSAADLAGVFETQLDITYDAMLFGASDALVERQNDQTVQLNLATAKLETVPGC